MAIITLPNTFTAGNTIVASEHNSNFSTIYNDYNGNITNANLSGSAAVADSKLAQITTASKVSGAALTSLSLIPSGAGDIPSVNLDGNACVLTGNQTVAGVKTFSSIPVLPSSDPTTDNQAARKKYIDDGVVGIEDYGTSTGTGTAKNLDALFIVYGTTTALAGDGTFVITSLPFASSSSYIMTGSNLGSGAANFIGPNITRDSGSQATITNSDAASQTFMWFAIGT